MTTATNGTDGASSPLTGLLALPHSLTMDNTYCAALLGAFFSLIMYGVFLHQTYSYVRIHSGDSFWLKFYVAVIFLLDTAHSVLIMALCYLKLVTNFFDLPYLVTVDWPMSLLSAITAANVVACQSFFAYRVYQIDRKYQPVVWFCMICQSAGFGLAIAFTVKAFQTPMWTELARYSSWISIVLGIAVVIDTILAAVLVVYFHRRRTGVKATNSLLDTLIAYAVTTGALTEQVARLCIERHLFNILGFVFALATSQSLYYAAANMLGTKVYTNSVMAALNFRKSRTTVGNQPTDVFSDIRIGETSSSSEVSHSPGTSPPSQDTFNTATTASTIEGIQVKVEKRYTYITESGKQVEIDIPDLERGEER